MPNDGRNIIHALMVGHKDTGPVYRELMGIIKRVTRAQNIKASQEEKIKAVYALLVGLISAQLKGDPLYWVKYQEGDEKENVENYRKRIGKDLFKGLHFYLLAGGCNLRN